MYELEVVSWVTLATIAFVVVSYIASRAVAVAWFRTKLEYLRSVMKEGRENGES